jgi:hypothetical protein
MVQFKYTLDKSSKKFICLNCGKKTLVKYIETETKNYLSDEFGRCDRETNCGYHKQPSCENNKTFKIVNIPDPPPTYHSLELVQKSFMNSSQNNFVSFLHTLFDGEQVKEAISKYLISTSKHYTGGTVFWQIDNLERIHAGKILQYNSESGKRVKDQEGKSLINWVHSVLRLKDYNLKQCLFGLQLINERNINTIAIVEAEKTAVIMSLFKPEYTWLSTGSKQGFKHEYLKPIKKYKIIAFPDKSEYNDWHKKANELNKQGFNVSVSDLLENINYPSGTDLADVYIDLKKRENIFKKHF